MSRYKPYCFPCFCVLNPNEKIVRFYKTKESAFFEWLRSTFPDIDWIRDRTVDGGCSRRRPDFRPSIDAGHTALIIDLDENQHASYNETCENKRLMEIFTDLGSRPLYVLRINPDGYKDEHGKVFPSCFNKKEMNVDEWKRRLIIVKMRITEIFASLQTTFPPKELTVEKLFFSPTDSLTV